jgi:hypothetical protein
MTNSKKKSPTPMANVRQKNFLTILDEGQKMEPGSFDVDARLRAWLSKAIAKYSSRVNKSRHVIAGELGELLDWEISKSMLDSWTAESHINNRIPALVVPAACALFGDYEGLRILCVPAMCQVLESDQAIYAEIAKQEAERKKIEQNIQNLKLRAQALK